MGAAIGRSGLQHRLGAEVDATRKATWIGIISANLPDIDMVAHLWLEKPEGLYQHRGITHSIVGWVIGSLILTFLVRLKWRSLRFFPVFLLCIIGVASHIFMDLTTAWGTMVLLPFSDERLSLQWLFIIDLILILFLVAPWFIRKWLPEQVSFRGALMVCCAYICMCGFAHNTAKRSYRLHLEQLQIENKDLRVFPAPFAPFMWTGTAHDAHNTYVSYLAAPFSGTKIDQTHAHNLSHPAVVAFRNSAQGQRYFWWARAPVAKISKTAPDEVQLELTDLRFDSVFNRAVGWKGFRYRVDLKRGADLSWRVTSKGYFIQR